MTYIDRELEKKINPFLKRKEAIAIIGPRQAGKTTFLRHLEQKLLSADKKVKFINFERKSDLDLFQDDIEGFRDLNRNYKYLFIDEFQYAKDGGQKLKYLYDTTDIKFIVSGSSSFDLLSQTSKYMVGRLLDFRLSPFSFREYLSFQDKDLRGLLEKRIKSESMLQFNVKEGFKSEINKRLSGLLEKYVIYGGYPAVVLAKSNLEKEKLLEGIMEKYLIRDIRGLFRLVAEDNFVKLTKFLATQIGNMIRYDELSNVSGATYKEVIKNLNVLEKTFIIKLIRPFFVNKRTELSKNPKVYFIDLGMRNYMLSDFRPLSVRNDYGAVMENYAYNLLYNLRVTSDLKYWRTKSRAEVDFVAEKDRNAYPIEIKYASKKTLGKSFYSFIEKFKPKTGIILTKDYLGEEKIKNTKIKFIPLSYF